MILSFTIDPYYIIDVNGFIKNSYMYYKKDNDKCISCPTCPSNSHHKTSSSLCMQDMYKDCACDEHYYWHEDGYCTGIDTETTCKHGWKKFGGVCIMDTCDWHQQPVGHCCHRHDECLCGDCAYFDMHTEQKICCPFGTYRKHDRLLCKEHYY